MSSLLPAGRPLVRRTAVVGLGVAAALCASVPAASAAPGDVVLPLDPSQVALSPILERDPYDPANPPTGVVPLQYGGSLTLDLPPELDDSAAVVEIVFDADHDGTPEAAFTSSSTVGDPDHLAVSGRGTGHMTITLPADPSAAGDSAVLTVEPLRPTLSPVFTTFMPMYQLIEFDAAAPAVQTWDVVTIAQAQVLCGLDNAPRCPLPTPIPAGSTITFELTPGSVLRELGMADLADVELGYFLLNPDGSPSSTYDAEVAETVSGSSTGFTIPAEATPGSYEVTLHSPTPGGGILRMTMEVTVVAPAAVAAPPAAAGPQGPVLNTGLRSNTGVGGTTGTEDGSAGTTTMAIGTGLLLASGVGAVAVARSRRRLQVGDGTCES